MQQVQLQFPQEYSVYTQELLAKPPSWILRWGGGLIFSIMLTMIALSWVVKYPDIIRAEAIITTPIPPLPIIARESGKLRWLITSQSLKIGKDRTIAIIENPASVDDINLLKNWLQDYQYSLKKSLPIPAQLKLGEVQNTFAHFQKQLNEYRFFETLNPLAKKVMGSQQKQQQLQQILKQHRRQRSLLTNEYALINKKLERYQKLQSNNLVAETQIDEIKISLLSNKRQQEQINSEISNIALDTTNQEIALTEYKLSHQEKLQQYKLKLAETFLSLVSDITKWEQRYLLKSPISGKLTLSKFWSEHQFVKAGEEVVTVVPGNNQAIIAKLKMPIENSGKVKRGQKILIKLAGYPHQEYGQIESQVDSISLVPREDLYTIEAKLPSPLVTSFNKTLEFNQEMKGKAEIVTEDMRLIERFFYQIVKILNA